MMASRRSSGKVQAYTVRDVGDDYADEIPVPSSWEIVSIGENGYEIKLKFDDAAAVSQGDLPDTIYLEMELGQYKDING